MLEGSEPFKSSMCQKLRYNVNSFFDRRMTLLTAILLLMGVWAVPPANGQPTSENGAYRLGPTDVIKVTVLKQDLLTQDGVRIGNDGNIRVPMLNEPLRAACLTEAELATAITEQYKKYLLNPQVYVTIKEFNSNSIAVIGAVTTPGRFQLQRQVRLLEVLALVNGPSALASEELQIIRTSPSDFCDERNEMASQTFVEGTGPEIISLKIREILSGSDGANPVLRGGDIVRVATAELKQAYVIGNVRAATTVNLKDPVALSTAIAMAGGTVTGTRLEKIKITRQSQGSLNKTDIFVNLKEIRAGSQPDVLLEPNDVVDVPGPSATRRFFKDILRTMVPIFTGVPVILP